MGTRIKKGQGGESSLTLTEFIDPSRSILIRRNFGGAGDILMQRPIFDEIKRRNPLVHVHYTLPKTLIPLVIDLASIDKIIPVEELGEAESRYRWKKDISTACIEHENTYGRNVFRQRTDVWADHLGIEVTDHSTTFRFTDDEIAEACRVLQDVAGSCENLFFISPHSADPRRNLTEEMVAAGVEWARSKGLTPLIVHHAPIPEYSHLPTLCGTSIRTWMASMTFPTAMLTTDSAPLHLAGFMGIPTAAMFNYTSGRVVPAWYPTVVPFDVHRDRAEGLACSPCYHWSACPYLKQENNRFPLRCVRDISINQVTNALNEAWENKGKLRYSYEVGEYEKEDSKVVRTGWGRPGPSSQPEPKDRMDLVKLVFDSEDVVEAVIACAIATSIRSVFEGVEVFTKPKTSEQESLIRICPFISIGELMPDRTQVVQVFNIGEAARNRGGWRSYLQERIGCSLPARAVFSPSSQVTDNMWESFGERPVAFCSPGLAPENFPIEYVVEDSEYFSWEERVAIIKLADHVVTKSAPVAMIASLVGGKTDYHGDTLDVQGFDRVRVR